METNEEQAPAPDQQQPAEKSFTQADVDRIVADRLRRAPKTEDVDTAVAAAKKETEDAVRGEVRRERVLDRIEALAAKDFADTRDARLRLGDTLDQLVDADGNPDSDAIKTELAALLTAAPHLAATATRRPWGDADQGHRNPTKPDPAPGIARLTAAYGESGRH